MTITRRRNGDTYRGKEWIGVIDRTLRHSTTYGSHVEVIWKVYDLQGQYLGAFLHLTLAKLRLDILTRNSS
jgi:hypothetical protein